MRRRLLLGAAGGVAAALAAPAVRAAPAPLVVWFTVEGAKGLRRVAQRFTQATGVPVEVETPDEGSAKFQQAAAAGKGPDLYVYAHDRIGEWIAGGLLHAVTPHRELFDDIDPLAWSGFGARGRLWGYPYAVEAVNLVFNKALAPVPPASFDDLLALDDRLARDGRRAILWDYTNAYFTWPLLAAGGGFAFQRGADGRYDPRRTGVNLPGAVAAAELLARMVREGRMPAGAGYPDMEAAMAQGRVAMMINGPWSWVNLQKVGIDYGVAPLPTLGGRAAVPFVGVKGIMVNRATRQRELAVEFVEHHMLQRQGLRDINAAEPIGAPASRGYYGELQRDARIAAIMASARHGVPTPSLAEMGRFWAALKSALTTLTEGRQDARAALDAAARRITGEAGA